MSDDDKQIELDANEARAGITGQGLSQMLKYSMIGAIVLIGVVLIYGMAG